MIDGDGVARQFGRAGSRRAPSPERAPEATTAAAMAAKSRAILSRTSWELRRVNPSSLEVYWLSLRQVWKYVVAASASSSSRAVSAWPRASWTAGWAKNSVTSPRSLRSPARWGRFRPSTLSVRNSAKKRSPPPSCRAARRESDVMPAPYRSQGRSLDNAVDMHFPARGIILSEASIQQQL